MISVRGFGLACILTVAALDADAQLAFSDCRLTAARLAGISAECARLTVPENRADADGRTIELFAARVPALNAEPREDPLVLVAGGPGQGTVDFYLSLRTAFDRVRADRDILLLDQRGTGRSAPLSCPEASAATLEVADPAALPSLMRECLAALDGDPRFYTTSVAVLDLESLRTALQLQQWNLYGISYGTRVVQHYLRRYPQHARAAILDGVVPSDLPLGPAIADAAQRVLDALFARCTSDAACAVTYPNLAARFSALLARLAIEPAAVTLSDPLSGEPITGTLSREQLASVVRLLSYAPQTAALLPLLIDAADKGNIAPAAAQNAMVAAELETALSLPMHNAVVCTEDVPFFTAERAADAESAYLGSSVVDALRAACSVWPAGTLDADLRTPLVSETPVLLLSGDADPITPPAYAERVRVGLSRARHLIGPGQGHGMAGVACIPRLMRTFLDGLEPASLDAQCLDRAGPSPFFLDFYGPAP